MYHENIIWISAKINIFYLNSIIVKKELVHLY